MSSLPPPSATGSDLSPAIAGPAFISKTNGYEATAHEFERGMEALGFEEIHPQQWAVQHVTDSVREGGRPSYRFVSVNEPRRSGKSESTYAVLLGRCLERPGYRVALTFATTGTKAAQRFKTDIFERLEAWADITGTDLTCIRSNGHEGVKFGNGSVLQILPPKGDAFRSEAFDVVLVDEAGEADKGSTGVLLESILPTLDTRPTAQLIVAGTPPEFRDGNLLWDFQTRAQGGKNRYGGVFYGVPYDLTAEDVETWELVAPLVAAHHPGVNTLTELDDLEANFDAMGPMRFMREYLGQAGRDEHTAGVINPAKWKASVTDADLSTVLPEHFAVVASVGYADAFGSIAAAWRDADGRAVVCLLEHRPGSAWIPQVLSELATQHRHVPFGCDERGTAAVEAATAERNNPRLTVKRLGYAHVSNGAAVLVREVHNGNLLHFGQEPLTDAALLASRREIGTQKAFGFGRPTTNAQIGAIEAASLALSLYDATPAKSAMQFTFV